MTSLIHHLVGLTALAMSRKRREPHLQSGQNRGAPIGGSIAVLAGRSGIKASRSQLENTDSFGVPVGKLDLNVK